MLVLNRKQGQKIQIGDDIIVTVVRVDGGKVRIGIEAPRSVPVDREEMRQQRGIPTVWGEVKKEAAP